MMISSSSKFEALFVGERHRSSIPSLFNFLSTSKKQFTGLHPPTGKENIRNEVSTVMEQKDFKMTISVIQEFSYLERCLKESLRLYPSVHSVLRYISKDMQLKNYLIPAGTTCNVSIHSLHRNPEFWPNPDVFDPDRFLPENMKGRNPYSYLPFSIGPRNCIGQKFAMLELKLMVAHILYNFNLEPVDELNNVKIMGDVLLRSSKTLRVKFIPSSKLFTSLDRTIWVSTSKILLRRTSKRSSNVSSKRELYIMFFTIFLSFFTLLLVLHCFVRYGRVGRISSRIPGPKAYPIIGNLYHFRVKNEQILEKFWKTNDEFYPIHRVWSFFFSLVTLLHPEDVEILLKSTQHLEKVIPYNFLRPWLSTGLITSSGDKWKQRRTILLPTFHFNILKHFVVTLNEEAQYLVTSLKEEGKGEPIVKDLQELIPIHTLNAICETAMGTPLKGMGELETKYRDAVHAYGKIVMHKLTRPWYHFDTIFALSRHNRLQKELVKTLHDFSKKIIAERKLFHEQTNRKYLQNFGEMDASQTFSEKVNENNQSNLTV
ncbi:hypothetical protein HZH66_009177 [Vespula vulgaris]|uniref:Cytochrome P450 n=1 Tax=Vespula vulgaris TaxID=7454 RepID=A0A834JM63_VESVU|nr:hypothetical protein HZH66_009177 [Vespula vulgaris]